jgi:hypothetical protein
MMNIRTICCLPTSATFVSHPARPQEKITVKELRALVSHSSDINQQILNMFMTILKHQLGVSFLDSSFFTLLKDGGWNRVKRWLRTSKQENQNHKPSLLDPAIIFPCHIHSCHWVAVTQRVIAGSVYFLYADDMNQPNTEKIIRQTLSTSSTDFYPKGTTWINCCNYTYLPHSNECGIRTLLALTIQALHPYPYHQILLPYMHENLAQIGRTWIALTLLCGSLSMTPIQQIISHQFIQNMLQTKRRRSYPHYIIPWQNITSLETTITPDGKNRMEKIKNTELNTATTHLNNTSWDVNLQTTTTEYNLSQSI